MAHRILVTGGAGFIGSHTCIALIEAGYTPFVLDNLCNSHAAALERVERIAGMRPELIRADVRSESEVRAAIDLSRPEAVVHFAGFKSVAESVRDPLTYYSNNVAGTVSLLRAMAGAGLKRLVFSSSCTVYGDGAGRPVTEATPFAPINPYGHSKATCERVLADLCASDPAWRVTALRYFNPVGAHESGLLGEDPLGPPSNVMPYIAQVAVGRREHLQVFGNDYRTRDGTGVRDYLHVMDVAEGHVSALRSLDGRRGLFALNLGRGAGFSVLELVAAFERNSGRRIPYQFAPRRPGDAAEVFADPSLAERELEWRAQRDLDRMCADTWRWQSMNPEGLLS